MKASGVEYVDRRGQPRLRIMIDVPLDQVKRQGVDACSDWARKDVRRRLGNWWTVHVVGRQS